MSASVQPKRSPRRFLDTLNVLLVLGALGVVFISASPALLRAAGLSSPRPEVGSPQAGRLALPRPAPTLVIPTARPFFAPIDEDDPDQMYPTPRTAEERRRDREIFPGRRDPRDDPDRTAPRVHDPSAQPGSQASPGEARARFGVVRHKVALLEKPGEGARSLGEVRPGEMVMVIKEAGDYALIAYSGDDGVLMGWAKKSEIAVR